MYSTSNLAFQTKWTADGVQLIGNVPARLTRIEAATAMGFHPDGMTPLANKKLFEPMGAKGRKKRFKSTYYSTIAVINFMNDEDLMAQAQYEITKYNKENQARCKAKLG